MKHKDYHITIGDNNKIEKSIIVTNGNEKKESWLSKWWWTFVVPIATGLIVGVILYFLKMN